jgi:hypothetical protein
MVTQNQSRQGQRRVASAFLDYGTARCDREAGTKKHFLESNGSVACFSAAKGHN